MSDKLVPQALVDFIIQAVVCVYTNEYTDYEREQGNQGAELAFLWGATVYQPDTVTELEKHRHRIKYNARARALWAQVESVLDTEMKMKVLWQNLDNEGKEAMVLFFE